LFKNSESTLIKALKLKQKAIENNFMTMTFEEYKVKYDPLHFIQQAENIEEFFK
jgi:hypothetical protein